MSNHRPLLIVLALLVTAAAFGDDLRILPATEETKNRVAASVRAALTSKDAEGLENIFGDTVMCGPRLWQQLRKDMPNDKTRVGTATLLFDPASGRESWNIEPFDVSKASDNVRKTFQMMIEAEPGRILVEWGIFRGAGVKLLVAALQRRFLPGEISVSQASKEDLGYYWLMIPWDIEEPVLRIDLTDASLLVDMDEERIMWIDVLPGDIASAERTAKK
jgi:hypothetical protein